MGRRNVIDGLVNQLRLVGGFAATDSGTAVAYDHTALGKGVNRAAIVLADRFDLRDVTFGGSVEADWYLEIECWIRNNNDLVQARKDADTYVQNIIDHLNANRTLGGSVWDSAVISGMVEDENLKIGSNAFLLETLTVKATEQL